MPACPRCKSIECESTHFDNVPFDQVASGALAARQAGRPAHAITAVAVWGCIELLMVHDYSRRNDVERTELIFPADAPAWVHGITREDFWNRVDANEKRKDAQTARELRLMIPRELSPAERVAVVRDFVERNFVSRGMVADVAWHNKIASDGQEQPQPMWSCSAPFVSAARPSRGFMGSNGRGTWSRRSHPASPAGANLHKRTRGRERVDRRRDRASDSHSEVAGFVAETSGGRSDYSLAAISDD